MSRTRTLLLVAAFATTLAGCGSSVKLDEDAKPAGIESRDAAAAAAAAAAAQAARDRAAAAAAAQTQAPTVAIAPSTIAPVTPEAKDPLTDPASPLARRSIYFDYDQYAIRPEFLPVLEAHARYLNANRSRRIVIEGNSDERGPREYNLSLGQRRAEAVRRALAALGVAEEQSEAISFGEERLRALGTDEGSHAENRRADIVYK